MACYGPGPDSCSDYPGGPLFCKEVENNNTCVEKCPDNKYTTIDTIYDRKICKGEHKTHRRIGHVTFLSLNRAKY